MATAVLTPSLAEPGVVNGPARADAVAEFSFYPRSASPPQAVPFQDKSKSAYESKVAKSIDMQPCTIEDVTGRENTFTLDANGFQFVKHVSQETHFLDEQTIKTRYFDEVAALVKQVTGASRAIPFHHVVRRPTDNLEAYKDPSTAPKPFFRVHCDYSSLGGLWRAQATAPDLFEPDLTPESLPAHPAMIVNVWRPIKPVVKHPFAVVDALSVPGDDYVPFPILFPDRRHETLLFKHSPGHRWFYKNAMQPDDVMLFKCYDSRDDGRARFTPHSAFNHSATPEGVPERESIEVRVLTIFDDQ